MCWMNEDVACVDMVELVKKSSFEFMRSAVPLELVMYRRDSQKDLKAARPADTGENFPAAMSRSASAPPLMVPGCS